MLPRSVVSRRPEDLRSGDSEVGMAHRSFRWRKGIANLSKTGGERTQKERATGKEVPVSPKFGRGSNSSAAKQVRIQRLKDAGPASRPRSDVAIHEYVPMDSKDSSGVLSRAHTLVRDDVLDT